MRIYNAIVAAFLALFVVSCNDESALNPYSDCNQVRISARIAPVMVTRVSEDGTMFSNNDAITVENTDRDSENLAIYRYSSDTGTWSTEDKLYWKGSNANLFKAWYPSTASFGQFMIPSDQTAGVSETDWMTATVSAKRSDGDVNLSFSHHLSKITVTIDSWSNEYAENEKVANSLELNSLSGEMFNDGTLSGDNTAKWVKAFVAQANTSFVAIIAPGTYASGDNIMQIYVNGSATPLAVKTSSALAIESGKAYRFKLSVGKDLAEITSDVTVDAWDDETLDDQYATSVEVSQSANCYIISQQGQYSFKTVKGNSNESVGDVASAEVLWESFGTDVTPNVGDLVKNVSYKNGEVTFQTADTFKEGNAVIAAKDASGNILWSWHIWFTDQPQEQVYYNNAGTMMDRNLGATSATPGDVGALGLLYQWGRKDPFLGSSSISEDIEAASTITWPSAVLSDASTGTIEYTVANPTSFIIGNDNNGAWYDSNSLSTDNILWTTSSNRKSIYDPCPSGWRISDGGDDGVWSKALGSAVYFQDPSLYDETNKGMNLSGKLGSDAIIWYPAACYRDDEDGLIHDVGDYYYGWTSYNRDHLANYTFFDYQGVVNPSRVRAHSFGFSARCIREGTTSSTPEEPETSQPSYSVQLTPSTYGWVLSSTVSNPDASLYDGVYESTNQGVNDSESIMYIDINGYDEFTVYVRSYAESTFDYVQVSNLDTDISSVKMTTSGNQKSGTSLSSYTEVTFSNIGGGQHRIMVVYKKDYSQHSNDDKGYVLIPKNHGINTPEVPSEPQDGDYVDEYGINHGQGIELYGVVWAPVNCGYHATDYKYGKLYQWGRKFGQGYEGPLYDENGNESGTYSDASVPSIVSDPVSLSVGQSSSNSDKFYVISSSPYDWVTPQDDTLWNSGTEDNPVKTEYDPCPEGWRVPTNAELNNLQSKYWSMTTNNGQEGCLFGGKVFFPAAGYRLYIGASAYARGLAGIYWSSTPYDPGAHDLDINTKGGYGVVMAGAFRVNGYSVRCVRE